MMEEFKAFSDICAKGSSDPKMKKRCEKDDMPKQISDSKQSALSKIDSVGVATLKQADSLMNLAKDEPDSAKKDELTQKAKAGLNTAKENFQISNMIVDTIAAVWNNLGTIEARLENPQAAVENYDKGLKYSPNNINVLFAAAMSAMKMKDYSKANGYFGLIAEKDTSNAEAALSNQAICYQYLKDEAKLKETYDKILKINPGNSEISYFRGMYYVQKANSKEIADSSSLLDSLSGLKPNDKGLDNAKKDLLAFRLKLYETALPDFKAAAEAAKTDADYWYWYGFSALLSNRSEEAEGAYKKCVDIKPDQKDCWCQLETVLARLKKQVDFDAARKKCDSLQ
jgi:tetratricopeptide (TPR) repeat protein